MATVTTVLVVSRDDVLVRHLSLVLEQAGMAVSAMPGPDEALVHLGRGSRAEVILLDCDQPYPGAGALCRNLRQNVPFERAPIIAVVGPGRVTDMVEALEAGADDCVTRSAQPDLLIARIRALWRRAVPTAAEGCLRAGPMEMDLDRWMVSVDGEPVKLTKKEFRLLQLLLQAKGRVLSRDFLIEQAWPSSNIRGIDTRTLNVHMGRLRRKLGRAGRHIITVRNVGFRCDLQPEWLARTNPNHAPALRPSVD